jgi:hypothetical protein
MDEDSKRVIIQDILDENRYSDWRIYRPTRLDPTPSGLRCILLNSIEKRKAELVIPDGWVQDPRLHNAVAQLLTLAIQYSRPVVWQGNDPQFFVLVPKRQQSTAA